MTSAIRELVAWNLRYDARRPWGWLLRGGYLAVVLLVLFATVQLNDPARLPVPLPIPLGRQLLVALSTLHALYAILAGAWLAGDAVADRQIVSFMEVSGLSATHWMIVRCGSGLIIYLTHWVLRWPLYFLLIPLQGVAWPAILAQEAALFVLWGVYYSVGLWVAQDQRRPVTRQMVIGGSVGVVFGLQLLLRMPFAVVAYLMPAVGLSAPLLAQQATELLTRIALPFQLFVGTGGAMMVPALVAHVLLAGFLLVVVRLKVYSPGPSGFASLEPGTGAAAPSRPRARRCWDDALAWQAYFIHGPGDWQVKAKGIVYAMAGAFLIVLAIGGYPDWPMVILAIGSAAALIQISVQANNCWTKEFNEKTLSTLILLPYDGLETFDGWQRGVWRICRPDCVWLVACAPIVVFLSPNVAAPLYFGAASGVIVLPVFFNLGALVPLKWNSILPAVLITFGSLIPLILCVTLGMVIFPWAGVMTVWAYAYALRIVLRRMINRWWIRRAEEIA